MEKKDRFTEAVQKNERLIYKVAGFYVDNLHDRQDLVQEIIYQLWKSFDSFGNRSSVTTWMYRVAMNTAICFLNKTKRRISTESIDQTTLEYAASGNDDTEQRLKIMYDHIRQLNLIEKGVLMLFLEGKSHEEIGGLVGLSTSNVGTKLSRIREKLKKQITKIR
jgi:RNA polymerase sigma-70 factor (ECF subfamily)